MYRKTEEEFQSLASEMEQFKKSLKKPPEIPEFDYNQIKHYGRNISRQSYSKGSKRYKDRAVGPLTSNLHPNDSLLVTKEPEIEDKDEPESEKDAPNDYADPIIPKYTSKTRPESSKISKKARIREGIKQLLLNQTHEVGNTLKFYDRTAKTDNENSQNFSTEEDNKEYWDSNYGSLGRTTKSELNKLLNANKAKIKNKLKNVDDHSKIDPKNEKPVGKEVKPLKLNMIPVKNKDIKDEIKKNNDDKTQDVRIQRQISQPVPIIRPDSDQSMLTRKLSARQGVKDWAKTQLYGEYMEKGNQEFNSDEYDCLLTEDENKHLYEMIKARYENDKD